MPLGIPHPGGGVVLWCAAPHRPRFGALLSLLCSCVNQRQKKSFVGFPVFRLVANYTQLNVSFQIHYVA